MPVVKVHCGHIFVMVTLEGLDYETFIIPCSNISMLFNVLRYQIFSHLLNPRHLLKLQSHLVLFTKGVLGRLMVRPIGTMIGFLSTIPSSQIQFGNQDLTSYSVTSKFEGKLL